MGKTNTLTSHHPERRTIRLDKMPNSPYRNGVDVSTKRKNSPMKFWKLFTSKKRRQLLKQNKEEKL